MLGTVLHVAVWLSAVGFDLALFPQIDSTNAPSAMVFWTLGFVPMVFGLVVLLVATAAHATGLMPIAEGGAPPYMMTLFIGGAQISLILTILQIVATVGTTPGSASRLSVEAFDIMDWRAALASSSASHAACD